MNDPLAFVAALQLGDSLFPSGGFTLSHGLETLVAQGLVKDEASLTEWLETVLAWQVGPSDGVAGGLAWQAAHELDQLAELDRHLLSLRLAREPREAAVRAGRQLLTVAASLAGPALEPYRQAVQAGRSPGCYAVVLGLTGRVLGLSRAETVLLLLHLYLSSVLGAALRLFDLDHVAGQLVRHRLGPVMVRVAEASLARSPEDMYASAPTTELMAMLHERAAVRLFAS